MEQYVGLDVSLKMTAICIVDRTGKIERELDPRPGIRELPGSEPDLATALKTRFVRVRRADLLRRGSARTR